MSMWVAGASVVAGIGGSLIGAQGAKSAASSAAAANLQNTQATNAANLNLFNLSRGAPDSSGYGHAILPQYFGSQEQDLGQAAYNNFLKLSGQGNSSYDQLSGYQSQLNPALGNSLNALGNRFNGQDLSQRIGYSNPYFGARTNQANVYGQGYRDIASANVSGINTGLAQAINQMNAQRAQQGFLGNSTFDRNRALAATLSARQQAGVMTAQANSQANNVGADANLANAGDLRALQLANMDFQSNPATLGAALSSAGQYYNAPSQALSNSFDTAMQPLNYFRISPQAFQQQNMPTQTPGINEAQILGGAISQGAQAFGNYNFGNQLLSRYGGGNGSMTGLNPYTNPGFVQQSGLAQGYQFNPSASSFMNFSAPSNNSFGFGGGFPSTGLSLFGPPPGG